MAEESRSCSGAVSEVVRVVRIPYYHPFAGAATVAEVADVGLGSDTIVNRRVLQVRLRSRPGFISSKISQAAGSRNQISHWDEFAAAFGYLDSSGENYRRGKFSSVDRYLRERAGNGRYFDLKRARLAIHIYSLLERHGDFVLAVLRALGQPDTKSGYNQESIEVFKKALANREKQLANPKLPRNQAFHALEQELMRYMHEWALKELPPGTPQSSEPLDEKTPPSYPARTYAYLADIGAVVAQTSRDRALAELGQALANALKNEGFVLDDATSQIPPTFEAIHDAFSVTWDKYAAIFKPPVTQGTFERVVSQALMPMALPSTWKQHELELKDELPRIVEAVGDPLTNSARIDTVRLAAFASQLGCGQAIRLDGAASAAPEGPYTNAISEILLSDPRRYMVGHSRKGKRLWSVALLRR
jgi:hypothetical protein